jgi:hypothetical protein
MLRISLQFIPIPMWPIVDLIAGSDLGSPEALAHDPVCGRGKEAVCGMEAISRKAPDRCTNPRVEQEAQTTEMGAGYRPTGRRGGGGLRMATRGAS